MLTEQDYDAVIARVTDILESDLCDVTESAFLYGSTCIGEVAPGLSDIDFAVVCKGSEVEIDVLRRYADAFRPVLSDPRTSRPAQRGVGEKTRLGDVEPQARVSPGPVSTNRQILPRDIPTS